MADGYISSSPLPIGIGVPGPLGKGYGPLPLRIGSVSAVVVGKGRGPLPIIIGAQIVKIGVGSAGKRVLYPGIRDRIIRDDEELLEILMMALEIIE